MRLNLKSLKAELERLYNRRETLKKQSGDIAAEIRNLEEAMVPMKEALDALEKLQGGPKPGKVVNGGGGSKRKETPTLRQVWQLFHVGLRQQPVHAVQACWQNG